MSYSEKKKQVKQLLMEVLDKPETEIKLRGANHTLNVRLPQYKILIKFEFKEYLFALYEEKIKHIGLFDDKPVKVGFKFDDDGRFETTERIDLIVDGKEAKKFGRKLFNKVVDVHLREKHSKDEERLDTAIMSLSGFEEL